MGPLFFEGHRLNTAKCCFIPKSDKTTFATSHATSHFDSSASSSQQRSPKDEFPSRPRFTAVSPIVSTGFCSFSTELWGVLRTHPDMGRCAGPIQPPGKTLWQWDPAFHKVPNGFLWTDACGLTLLIHQLRAGIVPGCFFTKARPRASPVLPEQYSEQQLSLGPRQCGSNLSPSHWGCPSGGQVHWQGCCIGSTSSFPAPSPHLANWSLYAQVRAARRAPEPRPALPAVACGHRGLPGAQRH